MKRTGLAVSALVLAALAACSPKAEEAAAPAAPATPAASEGAEAPQIGDAATAAEIHEVFIRPGSDALFAAETAEPPADEAAWKALEEAAGKVIAGASLMKVGSRPQGREGWIAAADQVIAATKQTETDLKARTVENLVFTDGDMMTGCTACHQQFRDTDAPGGQVAAPPAPPAPPN
jgi:hypothetical protein